MDKNKLLKKQIITGVIGALLSLALGAVFIILELGGRWGTAAGLIVCGSLLLGFVGYAIGGLKSAINLGGYFFIALINFLLISIIPQPYKGIYIIVVVICLIAIPVVKKYLFEKEQDRAEKSDNFIGKRVEKIEQLEKEYEEETQNFINSYGHGINSIIVHTISDKYYQCIKGKEDYYFVYVGNFFTGVNDELLVKDFSDENAYIKNNKKDFVIPKNSIHQLTLKQAFVNQNLPEISASIKIQYNNKTLRAHIMYEMRDDDFFNFFEGLNIIDKRVKNVIEEEPQVALDQAKLSKLKLVNTILLVAGILVSAVFLFLPFAYRTLALISLSLPIIVIGLYSKFRDYFTLNEVNNAKKRANKNHKILCLAPLLSPLAGLALRALLDYDLIEFSRFLIYSLAFFLIIMAFLLLFTAEYRKKKSVIIAFIMFAFVYSPAFIVHTNTIFDSSEPYIITSEVTNMEISESSDSPDMYYLEVTLSSGKKVELKVSEEFYNTITVGDTVQVYEFGGFWQIPYAFVKQA